jgi:hypothetical protein
VSAAARAVVPSERTQHLARGTALPVGDERVRDSGYGDLLLAWREGHRVRASVRPV